MIGLSGWLLSFTPGKLPDSNDVDYVIVETIVDPTSGIDMDVSLSPGAVGLNKLRVDVRSPASDLTGLELTFVPPVGSNLGAIVQTVPLTGAGIAVSPDDYLPLQVAGAWTLQVERDHPDRQRLRSRLELRRPQRRRHPADVEHRLDPVGADRLAGADDAAAGGRHDRRRLNCPA